MLNLADNAIAWLGRGSTASLNQHAIWPAVRERFTHANGEPGSQLIACRKDFSASGNCPLARIAWPRLFQCTALFRPYDRLVASTSPCFFGAIHSAGRECREDAEVFGVIGILLKNLAAERFGVVQLAVNLPHQRPEASRMFGRWDMATQ